MQTYAEYLNTMTVKTLNAICKAGGYKGYSKLRKAELSAFIEGEVLIDWDGAAQVKILSTEVAADIVPIGEIMAQVAVEFSAPVKAAQIIAPVRKLATLPVTPVVVDEDDTEELIYAYVAMRRTVNALPATPTRLRTLSRMRALSAELRSRKVNIREI
jgi:hypothetical protein